MGVMVVGVMVWRVMVVVVVDKVLSLMVDDVCLMPQVCCSPIVPVLGLLKTQREREGGRGRGRGGEREGGEGEREGGGREGGGEKKRGRERERGGGGREGGERERERRKYHLIMVLLIGGRNYGKNTCT